MKLKQVVRIHLPIYNVHVQCMPIKGTSANSIDPDQILQKAAPDLVYTVCIKYRNFCKTSKYHTKNEPDITSFGSEPVQRVMVEESTLYKWVKVPGRGDSECFCLCVNSLCVVHTCSSC